MARQAAVDVCDSCTEAILMEAEEMGIEFAWAEAERMACDMGAEIADHSCDYRDAGKPCSCGCRRHDTPYRPSLRADIIDGLTHL